MNRRMKVKFTEKQPLLKEFQKLRASAGWFPLPDETARKGLENSLFCICAIFEDEIIGMGRIIGDDAIYFYLQDIVVLPEFQNKGVGKQIVEHLENWLNQNASENAFVGLMSAEGVKDFYKKFGYIERSNEKPGMFRIIKK